MATTLRTELTKAGCNVSTATILLQPGIGQRLPPGSPAAAQDPPKPAVTLTSTDARLDTRFIQRNGQDAPRCMAIDSNAVYIWQALPSAFQPGFLRIPITAAPYTAGTSGVPVIADF